VFSEVGAVIIREKIQGKLANQVTTCIFVEITENNLKDHKLQLSSQHRAGPSIATPNDWSMHLSARMTSVAIFDDTNSEA
jgi:hypothetical protein